MSCHLNHDVHHACQIFRKDDADEMLWNDLDMVLTKTGMRTNFNFMHDNIRDWLLCGTKHIVEAILREFTNAVNRKCMLLLPDWPRATGGEQDFINKYYKGTASDHVLQGIEAKEVKRIRPRSVKELRSKPLNIQSQQSQRLLAQSAGMCCRETAAHPRL